jgi:hypothetical protein
LGRLKAWSDWPTVWRRLSGGFGQHRQSVRR